MYFSIGAPYTPEETLKLAKMKTEVMHSNTRFKKTPFKAATAPVETDGSGKTPAILQAQGRIGIDGKELEKETPKINGHSLVRTPSPTPGEQKIYDSARIRTWNLLIRSQTRYPLRHRAFDEA